MIRLRDLIEALYKPGGIWKLPRGQKRWGAKNLTGRRRYFAQEKSARDYASGKTGKRKDVIPDPIERPEKHDPKQTYSK